ncbi:MAG: hypothetical protein M3Q28_05950 [Pseudomonadota bacterium]|nr:hypothetical protein [Pseudomonadota bacterium]
MRVALISGNLGIAWGIFLAPARRLLRVHSNSKMSDAEYFAAARKRAIEFRLAKAAARKTAVNGSQ